MENKIEVIDTYTIKCPYSITTKNEVEIVSDNIMYSEVGLNDERVFIGVQCNNKENAELIKAKCIEVADLIREIDELNKTK